MWTKARLTTYLIGALGALGFILQAYGLATYDVAAQTIDPHPISIPVAAGVIVAFISPVIAALAVLFKWGHAK